MFRLAPCLALLICLCACQPAYRHRGEPVIQLPVEGNGLRQWERVRNAERANPSFTGAGLAGANSEMREEWLRLREKLKDAPLADKLVAINDFFNQWPWKSDKYNWGKNDYWETPREFAANSGDCEDFAVVKYYALRDLGVPMETMRIAAIWDNKRKIPHAVLLVYLDGTRCFLDQTIKRVQPWSKAPHYLPRFFVNEEFYWKQKPDHPD